MTFTCILCLRENVHSHSKEHVLSQFLGGRLVRNNIICGRCNNELSKLEHEFAEQIAALRNSCDFRNANLSPSPSIKTHTKDGEEIEIDGKGKPRLITSSSGLKQNPKTGEVEVSAGTEKQFHSIMKSYLKKQTGLTGQELDDKVNEARKHATTTELEPPRVSAKLALGGDQQLRVMAASILELCAVENDSLKISHRNFDSFRQFIKTGENQSEHVVSHFDTRELNKDLEQWGEYPNIVWVGQNSNGTLLGYFRLFGVWGWTFKLGDFKQDDFVSSMLIVDATDPKNWKKLSGDRIDCDWVECVSSSDPTESGKKGMLKLYKRMDAVRFERRFDTVIESVMKEIGVKMDSELTETQYNEMLSKIFEKLPYIIFPSKF